jgi:hypothetical protein
VSEENTLDEVAVLSVEGTTVTEVPGSPFSINNGGAVPDFAAFPTKLCK